jgi:hypothetical protein
MPASAAAVFHSANEVMSGASEYPETWERSFRFHEGAQTGGLRCVQEALLTARTMAEAISEALANHVDPATIIDGVLRHPFA